VVARSLQTSANHEFAGNSVVEHIVQLIEQRAALTARRLTDKA
jgi:serine/threonine-protein kinase HipA